MGLSGGTGVGHFGGGIRRARQAAALLGVRLVGPGRAEDASVFLGKRRSRRAFGLHTFLRGGGAGPSRRETGRTLLTGHFAAFDPASSFRARRWRCWTAKSTGGRWGTPWSTRPTRWPVPSWSSIRLDKSGKQTILRPFDVCLRETDFVVNVRLATLLLDSKVGVATLALDVDVEFVASGRRAALGVAEPPVAVQFLDGLADLVREDALPGFVAQDGVKVLQFDLDNPLGRFDGAAGRVDERDAEIFGRTPESFGATSVEFGHRDGKGRRCTRWSRP